MIVKDMLLTGFDVPIEQVMYLDRPLKEHTLLQAIARVNRTSGDTKKCGYVLDYYGVLDFLEEALAIFDREELGSPMESMDGLYNEMCHMIYKDHSKEFWDKVATIMPDYDVRKEWLKDAVLNPFFI